MKKVLIVFLVLVLLLAGFFLWKGAHHAIVVSEALEDWLDADHGDLSVTFQLQKGGFAIDGTAGQLQPKVDQLSLTADSFWTEYGDDQILGLSAGGITAYLRRGVLYMDTGRAYALPELTGISTQAGRLAAGLLLYGRITKSGDTYCLTMDTEELDLTASVTMDKAVRSVSVTALLPDQALQLSLTPKAPQPHPIPQPVVDAMVLANMERPMSLSEPLQMLLPALENLLPLSGSLKLGISSGILELSETVALTIDRERASLSRDGILIDLPLDLSQLSPTALGLMVLRSGTFTRQGDTWTVSLSLPGDATADLAEALVPQAAGLDITFSESILVLTIASSRLTRASIAASGSVPFLFTTIPLSFSADLTPT